MAGSADARQESPAASEPRGRAVLVAISGLRFRYRSAQTPALQEINLEIHEGEFVVIMGHSAAGKSTLCYTVNGLIPWLLKGDLEGEVEVCRLNTRDHEVREIVPHVGLVFQDFESQLSPRMLSWRLRSARKTSRCP
jgi:energy-coupling factor transporter ATP-binding protein EcfA2